MSDLFKIKVPATSANLGVGFDSMGIAVSKFLEIEARRHDKWAITFQSSLLNNLPANEENLIIQVAQHVAKRHHQTMPSLHLTMSSDIPLTHGLGSSASAIVAGVELANYYCRLQLDEEAKIHLATLFEGHPDNVGPCVTGGLFIGYYHPSKDPLLESLYYDVINLEQIALIVSIPPYEVSTKEARNILPTTYTNQEIATQNAIGSLMLLAALRKEYYKMGQLMMKDLIHEPYRQQLIPEFNKVKELSLNLGAYATVISGAGPTMLTLCPLAKVDHIVNQLQRSIPSCTHEEVHIVPPKQKEPS